MTADRLAELLGRFPSLKIAVLGDFFVDQYLELDPTLEEVSIETGLPAHQVTGVRCQPGAAGTVTNNLSALEVGTLRAIGFRGLDGLGWELERGLLATRVDPEHLHATAVRMTPTYTKPLVMRPGQPPRELSRLDLKNRSATPTEVEELVLRSLRQLAGEIDAIIGLDQVQERNHGVITDRVRAALASLGRTRPDLVIMTDSRAHIHLFEQVSIKPNAPEASALIAGTAADPTEAQLADLAVTLSNQRGRPVFITRGEEGVMTAADGQATLVPGIPVAGETDIVGAGDSFCAGATAALAAGATVEEAGMIGCLVASLTVQQIGTTGTTTRAEVTQRFGESPYGG